MAERRCAVCGDEVTTVFRRVEVPTMQNRLYSTAEAASAATTGTLDLVACARCGFVSNAAYDGTLVPYDESYENDQTVSPVFAAHVDDMARRVLAAAEDGATIAEAGCGQGRFLERLDALDRRQLQLMGFDPAVREPGRHGRIELVRGLLETPATGPADVVVSRHVIEHIADPLSFLRSLRASLAEGGHLFLETPCVDWIFANGAVQDLFYEHCSYFNDRSIGSALARSGFELVDVEHVFSGQYLWIQARAATTEHVDDAAGLPPGATAFAASVDRWIADWRRRLAGGRVIVWGAGAKGVTFANTIDPERGLLLALVDVNPKKQGSFVPVTAHEVMSWQEAVTSGATTAVVMNPNYTQEIAAMLSEAGVELTLMDA